MQVDAMNTNNTLKNISPIGNSNRTQTVLGREPQLAKEAPESQKAVPLDRSVVDAIEKANKISLSDHYEMQFSVHEQTQEIMVKIMDVNTQKVIKEIPPEKILDLIGKIMEMAGIIVDEKR